MLYCRRCGQSPFINKDLFIEVACVSGTENRLLDPDTGDCVEYGDSNIEGTGDSDTFCPHCDSEQIGYDDDITEEKAFKLRAEWTKFKEDRRKEYERENLIMSSQSSSWDA